MTPTEIAAWIIIGVIVVGSGTALAVGIALMPRLIASNDKQSDCDFPAVQPENWK